MFNFKKMVAYFKLRMVRKALEMVGIEAYITEVKEYDFIQLTADLWNCENGEEVSIGIAANSTGDGYDTWESYADPHTIDWNELFVSAT